MKKYFISALIVIFAIQVSAQKKTDANIIGHVVCSGEHIPFANIMIKNTTIGTATDETGHFYLINMPEGEHIVIGQALGYKPLEKIINIIPGQTIELKFELETDALGLEEVVVTGDRNQKNRKESTVIVSTLAPKALESVNSITVSEGLNFCSGLRMENNCQNCGFNQLRINGMEGPYSQILINSRAIFSGLASVYGLELIPTNMIERVEIIRGGGSALYGSNAIAGTVNMILKDPITNSYEFGSSTNLTGFGISNTDISPDISVNMNASIVSDDSKTGMSIYGFSRTKSPYDANGDGFSELSKSKNTTIGTRIFHRFNQKSKITFDYFNINDNRRGGNRFEFPEHVTDITEGVQHNINTVALNYDQFVREKDQFAIYGSAQYVIRDSYYGANYSLSNYGKTKDLSYSIGGQYTMREDKSTLVAGIESNGSYLNDVKLGYPDFENATIIDNQITYIPITPNRTIANQYMTTSGIFAQYDYKLGLLKLSFGGRFDNYQITDLNETNSKVTGLVFSPRTNILLDITNSLQGRISYSQGYRAPQVFDEDLHIETSGSRRIIHQSSDNLVQETSHSISGSLDFKKDFKNISFSFLTEGFYTILQNPFVNEYGTPDENGTVIYTRVNAPAGAVVKGINFELNFIPSNKLFLRSGFTIQQSMYEDVQEFDETSFLRTPSNYGFVSMEYIPIKSLTFNITGTYTGKMLVPYFGPTLTNPEEGELRTSEQFYDLGFKTKYNIKVNAATFQVFAGIKNIFNSYQKDFDIGINRDPAYIYGPASPRTIYFGIKFGNMIG